MAEAINASFKLNKVKIPIFSYNESNSGDTRLELDFLPSGRYIQKNGEFELVLELFGWEAGLRERQVVHVKCIAYFEFDKGLDFSEIPPYFYKNAIAIVFPFIRTFVSTLTLQANSTLLLLGIMNLSNLEIPLKNHTKVE